MSPRRRSPRRRSPRRRSPRKRRRGDIPFADVREGTNRRRRRDDLPSSERSVQKNLEKRKAALRKKKKEEDNVLSNTPPESGTEENLTQNKRDSRQKEIGRKIVRKDRAKAYRELKKQKEENNKLRAKLEKYKKRLQREQMKN
ncbi:hypothetical protein J6590_079130 [Homalodisca vitripennis]|nr:hypothetical protein J6590_079130 [Homalodisca vitripennis]